jgi:NTE family protein
LPRLLAHRRRKPESMRRRNGLDGPRGAAMDSHAKKTRSRPISLRSRPAISEVKHINLALQGGGAHGAFTWGVLDRLLEEPRIEVEGVSATSSGAMNAVAMAHGLTIRGREGARAALENFWHRVARIAALFSPLQSSPSERLIHNHGLENAPAHLLFEVVSRFLSPYQLNPFNYNPLRHRSMTESSARTMRSACSFTRFAPMTSCAVLG